MSDERFLLDTVYVLGLLNPRDEIHAIARGWFGRVREAAELWVTEAVLVEIGNGLAAAQRERAAEFIQQCYRGGNFHVVPVDTALLHEALEVYRRHGDKTWGLTDCISFVVMNQRGLSGALTADEHFRQAGFRALLAETP